LRIGVLGFQGSVREHLSALSFLDGVEPVDVKDKEALDSVGGLILPGGESTTISKLLVEANLMQALRERMKAGLPAWGTCAGLILMANQIAGEDTRHLAVLDVVVRRNAYGSQLDSFVAEQRVEEVSDEPQKLIFIRAPWVEEVGERVQILATHRGKIVAVKHGHLLGTAFHPELSHDLAFHRYFHKICLSASNV
jgi:pyridoxal 5'-phosphate synthase pdxT subunit